MFNNFKPKDFAVVLLTITLCVILIISTISSALMDHDSGGKTEEIIAFLLGSITTIVGEYVLLHLKNGNKDD